MFHSVTAGAKGSTLLAEMQNLGVIPSFSRPRVSNDNAPAETVFRTAKYCPLWPQKPFDKLDEARAGAQRLMQWYNEERRDSAIAVRHDIEAAESLFSMLETEQIKRRIFKSRWRIRIEPHRMLFEDFLTFGGKIISSFPLAHN